MGRGEGKGSAGDAETGNPNWASKWEKLLKLCFQTGKGLGITQTFAAVKPVFGIYSWEYIWERGGEVGQDGW